MQISSRPVPTPLRAALLAAVLASGNAAADPVPFDSDRWTFDDPDI